jgi:light-regulated signal transduction histidine kinase (bacteriophytochrome)
MSELLQSFDGSVTPDGDIERWPQNLRTAYARARGGESVTVGHQPMRVDRDGEQRETQVNLSFVPVRDEAGVIGGVLVSVVEAQEQTALKQAAKDSEALEYAISHDLRAPLRSMEEMARIMLADHGAALPEEVAYFLNSFVPVAAKLNARAESLVRFGRASRQTLSRRTVHVATIVDEIIAELRAKADAQQGDVVIGELPDVSGDPELIRLVFFNILSNAFKFTRRVEHPRIEIGGRRQQNQIAYFVADNGAGFDMKYAGKLFGLFQRMHSEAQFEGIGAGLALTRRIIERHGGTIRAESQKGHGSTFHFTLPACLPTF